MRTFKTIATAAALVVVIIAIATGTRAASERRAEYLERETAYFECIESGLSHVECVQGVGL